MFALQLAPAQSALGKFESSDNVQHEHQTIEKKRRQAQTSSIATVPVSVSWPVIFFHIRTLWLDLFVEIADSRID